MTRKLIAISLLVPATLGLVLPSVPDHGVLPGLAGQGVGGGADDHGLGSDDSPTFAGLTVTGNEINIGTSQTPASPSATGTEGDICWDADYIYGAVATNTWKRAAWSTWGVPAENVIYAGEDVVYAAEQVVYP